MTEAWIRQHFSLSPDGTQAMIPISGGFAMGVPIATMTGWWGGVALTHTALSETAQAAQGWQAIFDGWLEAGLITS